MPRPARGRPIEAYEPGRRCGHCDYDLGGVPVGNVCPECGKPTGRGGRRGGSGRIVESLMDAPMWYLKGLARGTMLLSGVLFGMLVMWFGGVRMAERLLGQWGPSIVWLVMAGLWWLGVFISTAPRALTNPGLFDPKREWRRVRVINRVTQLFWAISVVVGVALAQAIAKAAPPPMPPQVVGLQIVWALTLLVALFGLVPLCAQLADLAEWAQDSPLSARFNTAGGSIAFGGVINIVLELTTAINPLWFLFKFLSLMAMLLMIFGVVLFFVNVFLFARMVLWAINNKENLDASDIRRAERDRREAERQHERQQRIDEANRVSGVAAPVAAAVGEDGSVPLAEADVGRGPRAIKPEIKGRDRSITAPRNYATGGENRPREGEI